MPSFSLAALPVSEMTYKQWLIGMVASGDCGDASQVLKFVEDLLMLQERSNIAPFLSTPIKK
jgi:hypothetical protein